MKKYFSIGLIAIGALCNYLAMRFNGGKMPASDRYAVNIKGLISGQNLPVLTGNTRLKVLCDIIHIPHTFWMISVGDCLLIIGIITLFALTLKYLFKHMARFVAVVAILSMAIIPFTQQVAAVTWPVISDSGPSFVGSTNATILAYLSSDGGAPCAVSLYINGGWIAVDSAGATGANEHCSVGGLTPSTSYSYVWLANNGVGLWSSGGSFTTSSGGGGGGGGGGALFIPDVYGYVATGISDTGAILNGAIANDWGGVCQGAFLWGTASGMENNVSGWFGSYTTGQSFSYTLSSLSPGTTYYFLAYALNSIGQSDPSAEFSFTTSGTSSTSISIGAASSITSTTATLNGTISSELSLLQVRWAYGTTSQSSFTDYTNVGSFAGSFNIGAVSSNLTGLSLNTTYYYRFQVKDTSNNITTSAESSFTAGGYVTVSSLGASSITGTTATLNGSVISDGGYPGGVSIEFAYGTTSYASGSYASYTNHVALAGAFSTSSALNKAITSLTTSTVYYFMIRASNSVGYSYSSIGTFSTQGLPIISSVAASNVAKTTARLNSTLTSDGGSVCTITFGYGTVSHSAVAFASYTTKTVVSGTFAIGSVPYLDVSGLSDNTTYYFRVQAVNSVGTVVSTSEQTFITSSSVVAPTNIIGVPTNVSINLTWVLGLGSSGTLIRMSTTAYPTTTSDGNLAYSGTSGSTNIANLIAGTTYYFSAWGYSGATYSSSYATKLVTTQADGVPGASNTSNGSAVQIPNVVRWIGAPNYQTLENVPLLYPAVNGTADSLQMPREIAWAVLAFLTALITGIAVYLKSHSALGGVIAGGFVLGLWYVFQIVPLVYIFIYIAVGALLIRGGKEMDG